MHPQHHACRRRRGTDTAVATVATGAVRATCRIGCVVRLSAAGAHHAVGVVIAPVLVMGLMAVMAVMDLMTHMEFVAFMPMLDRR